MPEIGIEETCNKSSASGTRFLERIGGDLTNLSVCQPLLVGFDWVGNSLSKRSGLDMAARPSGKIAATEREVFGLRGQ